MKTNRFFLLVMVITFACPIYISAQKVLIDGLYYTLDQEHLTAQVARQDKASIEGEYTIEEQVVYEDVTYQVTDLADLAFYECNKLTSIVLPSTLRKWGNSVFCNCSALTSCIIPDHTIDTIPYCALFGTALTEFRVPDGVVYIEQRSFESMKSLERVYLPNSVKEVSQWAFHEQSPDPLKEPIYNDRLFVRMPRNYSGKYSIPSGIEVICGDAFFNCTKITSLTIPEGVKRIEQYGLAFGSGKMTKINLPSTIEYIHDEGIIGSFINQVTIADGCKRYKSWENIIFTVNMDTVIYGASYMFTQLTMPESVTHVAKYAFRSSHTDIILTNVKTIAEGAFWGNNLAYYAENRHFVLPETVEEIGDDAFLHSNSMWEVTIPSSVRKIGSNVFEASWNLKKANINNNCIASGQFYNCNKLETVELGTNIEQIATNAFFECSSLWYIRMPQPNAYFRTIDGVLFSADTTELVIYPRKHDGNNIILPAEVKLLRTASLSGVNINKLVMPRGLEKLNNNLFGPSTRYYEQEAVPYIDTIVAPMMSIPQTQDSTFGRLVRHNTVLLVPNDSLADLYRSLDVWKEFNIQVDESLLDVEKGVETTTDEHSVQFTWPTVEGATSYTLIIWANEEQKEKICTLKFNSIGQLIEFDFSRYAPLRQTNIPSTLSFRYTNLSSDTPYWFTFNALDTDNKQLFTQTGSFKTTRDTPTELDSTTTSHSSRKHLHNGKIVITNAGKEYSVQGQIIKH